MSKLYCVECPFPGGGKSSAMLVKAALCARRAQCPPAGHDQPRATRINAVASMPAKNAPIIGKAAINFARCERGPPSAHAARRHGSKYFLQSHADVHPPINERMNNKAVMLKPARGRFRPPFFDPALLRSACFADTRAP